jgi:hypothetical protein
MGDEKPSVLEIPNICENQPLLSPSNSSINTRRPSTASQQRRTSYGSCLPSYHFEPATLEKLLKTSSPPLKSKNYPKDSSSQTQVLLYSPEEEKRAEFPPSRSDSVISSPVSFLDDDDFIRECDKQLSSLFQYVSDQLNMIEEEIKRFRDNSTVPVDLTINSDVGDFVKINNEDVPWNDGDSGIGDDHVTSSAGFYSRIKDIAGGLLSHFESTLKQLDEMVSEYDERTQGNSAKVTLSMKHNQQRELLLEKLHSTLDVIDNELENSDDSDNEENQKKITREKMFKRLQSDKFSYVSIVSLILLLSTIFVTCFLSVYYDEDIYRTRWVIVLRLYRSPLLIVLYMFLVGFNLMVWLRYNINYIGIFKFPVNGVPTPKVIFAIASGFTLVFSSFCLTTFLCEHFILYITDKIFGLMMWLSFLLFLFNPFKMFLHRGRFSFILTIIKILVSPLPIVEFGDFWFADQLNSMVALMIDVQYLFCYMGNTMTWNNRAPNLKMCTTSENGIRPLISCLPSLWRFLQCLRCYQKTRKIAHIFNAIKYFTTFPVVVFSALFAVRTSDITIDLLNLHFGRNGWIVFLWASSTIIHAVFTFIWDVYMDWGLFHGCTLLRTKCYYPKWTYCIAIVFDFFVRFGCALKLTLAIVYLDKPYEELIYFALIVAELLRRWIWNFFRVEYEQVLMENNN